LKHCGPTLRTFQLNKPDCWLALVHRNPAQPWTIASLAKEAGVSRSVLAERFRHYLNPYGKKKN
jgi:AraC-like DNA-binding protein